MAITSENVVVLYRENDADSLAFAEYYRALHLLENDQLVGVPCSGDEVLVDYDQFYDEVEGPLSNIIDDAYYGREVFAIVIGYGVPGGFMDGDDVVSATSRLSRMNHSYAKQTANPLFNRKTFKRFDSEDAALARIVSRIDAPSLETAKELLDNTKTFIRRGTANGTFFFDKYTIAETAEELAYEDDLDDFESRTLPILNVPTFKTTLWDEYTDVVVPRLHSDSFMWGWRSSRAGYTFFKDNLRSRVFLYNADEDGAAELRDADERRFPLLAISSGYVTTAGAMSDPTPSGYLRPRPFFEALFRGATVGEAFMFACPHVDWTMTLIGDPLVSVKFPVGTEIEDGISQNAGWDMMVDDLSSAVAFAYRKNRKVSDALSVILDYQELGVKLDLLPSFLRLADVTDQKWKLPFTRLISTTFQFISPPGQTASPIVRYFLDRDIKISSLLNDDVSLPDRFLLPSGYWLAEDEIQHQSVRYTVYSFDLQVSLSENFGDLLIDTSTESSVSGWTYEKESGVFYAFPESGVPSAFAGQRVRYVADEGDYLDRGDVYYFRIRQRDDVGDTTDWRTFKAIVSS
jgi:uncharacterized protein (TIGR03790 family)